MFKSFIYFSFISSVVLIGNEKVKTLWCFVKPKSLNLLYPEQLHKGKLWNKMKLFTIKNKSLGHVFHSNEKHHYNKIVFLIKAIFVSLSVVIYASEW